jgi:hypothetical protein
VQVLNSTGPSPTRQGRSGSRLLSIAPRVGLAVTTRLSRVLGVSIVAPPVVWVRLVGQDLAGTVLDDRHVSSSGR